MHEAFDISEHLKKIIETQSLLVSSEFDLDSFMNTVVEQMQALTPATGAVIELVEGDEMVYKAASGTVAPYLGLRLARGTSLSGLCVADAEIKIAGDTETDPRVNAEACRKVGAASMVCVPLFQRSVAVGVLKVLSTNAHAFGERDIQTLQLMAGLLGGALGQQLEVEKRQQLEEQLRHTASHDNLTGLPNRMLFNDRLDHAVARSNRDKSILAVMYMDIDFFKSINDTHGHAVGDALLKGFAARVRALIRESDTFARLGGDEFTLICENLSAAGDAGFIAEKIVHAAKQPFEIGGTVLQVSSSIGICVTTGERTSPDELISRADDALYETKRAGRDGFKIFGSEETTENAEKAEKAEEAKEAEPVVKN